jgi:hypothetical protein
VYYLINWPDTNKKLREEGIRVAVHVGADLVRQRDAAPSGEPLGAADVRPAGGACGDVLEAGADGAAVGPVACAGDEALDPRAARPRHEPAGQHVAQARHQRVVHRRARQRRLGLWRCRSQKKQQQRGEEEQRSARHGNRSSLGAMGQAERNLCTQHTLLYVCRSAGAG